MIENLLISSDLSELRRDLVKSNNKDLLFRKQKEFAKLAIDTDNRKFIAYFKCRCKTQDMEEKHLLPPYLVGSPLTEDEFADPPQDTESSVFNSLRNLPRRLASSNAFWSSYHLNMVEAGSIKPSYLAKAYIRETGQARIEKAIASRDRKPLDDCVRTILRRMGGLPEVRGYTSVFQDCRTSRAWWRGCFTEEVHDEIGTEKEKVWRVLRTNRIWEEITGHVVEKLTVLGDRRIFIPLVACLSEMNPIPNDRNTIQDLLRRIGQRTAYQVMGVLSLEENLEIIKEIINKSVNEN